MPTRSIDPYCTNGSSPPGSLKRTREKVISQPRATHSHDVAGASASYKQQSYLEPLLNSKQTADLLRVHHKTLEKYARRGAVPGHFKLGRWYFFASELDAWLKSTDNGSGQSVRVN